MCLKNGSENVQIRVTILRCFTSWITIHAIPLETIPSSDVIAYALQVSLLKLTNFRKKINDFLFFFLFQIILLYRYLATIWLVRNCTKRLLTASA